MLEIYFDGVLIHGDLYKALTNDFNLFNDTFRLGSVSSNSFKLEVPSNVEIPNEIKIMLNGIDYANLIVDSYELVNENFFSLALTDKMVNFNFNYDASDIIPCTILELLQDICSRAEVELATTNFINCNNIVEWFDNRLTARDYISYISENAGGFGSIGQDGKLYIKKFTDRPVHTVDINTCKDFKIGEHHTVERVVFDNGLLKFETSSNEDLETLYLNSKNVFINDQETFDNIANEIMGFEFYCFETGRCEIKSEAIAGDTLIFTDGVNSYNSIAQYSLKFFGRFLGGYSLDFNSKQQQETRQSGLKESVKNLDVDLDRVKNELRITAEEIDDTNAKIANLSINVNNIENSVTETGGSNLLLGTRFFRSLENWEKSENISFHVLENAETTQISLSKRVLKLSDGFIRQSYITEIGREHTLSFKYKKFQIGDNESRVRIYTTPSTFTEVLLVTDEVENYVDFSYTYVATVSNPTIEIFTNNSDFYITALIVQQGISSVWSTNNLEISGAAYKLDLDGGHFYNIANDQDSSHINHNRLSFSSGANYGSYGSNAPFYRADRELSVSLLSIKEIQNRKYHIE